MKRVFISDMHIGDGFLCDNFLFDKELEELLLDLMDSPKETELVIVGDGLELMESRMVKDLGVLPFDQLLQSVDPSVINDIFNNHKSVFSALRKFCRVHKLTYIVGNHDYYFHTNKTFQERFKEQIGTSENIQFVPYLYDRDWGLFAIHGNNFDMGNSFGIDKKTKKLIPPIGDYMARYMMINFREVLINGDVPDHIPHDYDDVRPNMDVFDWFSVMMKTYDMGIDLVELWMEELLKMLKTVQAKQWMQSKYPHAHKLSHLFINSNRGVNFGRKLVGVVSKTRSLKKTNYMKRKAENVLMRAPENPGKYGFQDKDFYGFCEKPEIDYETLKGVVFAHRHKFENLIYPCNGYNKFYINTGTWRNVIEKELNNKKNRFVKRAELAYVMIEETEGELAISSVMHNKIKNKSFITTGNEVI